MKSVYRLQLKSYKYSFYVAKTQAAKIHVEVQYLTHGFLQYTFLILILAIILKH